MTVPVAFKNGKHEPIRRIAEGTTRARTNVASMRMAKARPNPICLMMTMDDKPNAEKTTTMMAAAPVIRRPVRCSPFATASVLSPVRSHSS
jgi:hypothetical protein